MSYGQSSPSEDRHTLWKGFVTLLCDTTSRRGAYFTLKRHEIRLLFVPNCAQPGPAVDNWVESDTLLGDPCSALDEHEILCIGRCCGTARLSRRTWRHYCHTLPWLSSRRCATKGADCARQRGRLVVPRRCGHRAAAVSEGERDRTEAGRLTVRRQLKPLTRASQLSRHSDTCLLTAIAGDRQETARTACGDSARHSGSSGRLPAS